MDVDQADPEAWQLLLTTNLTAAAVPTALVLPQLIEAAPSALVYIGSGAGRGVYANNAAYVAASTASPAWPARRSWTCATGA